MWDSPIPGDLHSMRHRSESVPREGRRAYVRIHRGRLHGDCVLAGVDLLWMLRDRDREEDAWGAGGHFWAGEQCHTFLI